MIAVLPALLATSPSALVFVHLNKGRVGGKINGKVWTFAKLGLPPQVPLCLHLDSLITCNLCKCIFKCKDYFHTSRRQNTFQMRSSFSGCPSHVCLHIKNTALKFTEKLEKIQT